MLDANIKAKNWQRDSVSILTDIRDQFASNMNFAINDTLIRVDSQLSSFIN